VLSGRIADKDAWQLVDRPSEGQAVCFDLQACITLPDGKRLEIKEQGFITCYQGKLRAWRNHCPHTGSPLDWIPGRFYNDAGDQLVCHTHGAHFDPLSGDCTSGPCPRGLFPLQHQEREQGILVPISFSPIQGC